MSFASTTNRLVLVARYNFRRMDLASIQTSATEKRRLQASRDIVPNLVVTSEIGKTLANLAPNMIASAGAKVYCDESDA